MKAEEKREEGEREKKKKLPLSNDLFFVLFAPSFLEGMFLTHENLKQGHSDK